MVNLVRVLMHKTLQPYGCKRLLMGEVYPLPADMADRIVQQGRGEIVLELDTEDEADAVIE